eukprot:scaffold475_cov279-Pinguiococcus_pyrenoidosus.AAC.5
MALLKVAYRIVHRVILATLLANAVPQEVQRLEHDDVRVKIPAPVLPQHCGPEEICNVRIPELPFRKPFRLLAVPAV